mgnify:CR=1 FL=1
MIEICNLSKSYVTPKGRHYVFKNLNAVLPENKSVGLLGKNGAGKSTLIRLINLLERPSEGQVIINQKDFTAMDARTLRQERANIGMIFQHFNLLQTKTVSENIEMPLRLLGHSKAEREKRLAELLDFIDLKHKKDAYPDELSGGQKQRVMIAAALALQPKILIADEPTTALDVTIQAQILDLLKSLNKKLNITTMQYEKQLNKPFKSV